MSETTPQINEMWIYSMVILGFIGCLVGISIIFIGYFKADMVVHSTHVPKLLIVLIFFIWIFNLAACTEWAFLRSNLFINLTKQRCIVIYTSNYLFYHIAGYFMHIVFLYGLFFVFKGTSIEINEKFIKSFIVIITINLIIFIILYIPICIKNVTIGFSSQSNTLQICTLFNTDSYLQISTYDKIFPIAQHLLIGTILLIICIKKISQLSKNKRFKYNIATEALIRKVFILTAVSICTTFIFYSFAVPFYPNFTFLLPFDAALNSLCIMLLIDYNHSLYIKLCFISDICLKKLLKHKNSEIVETVGTFRSKLKWKCKITNKYDDLTIIPISDEENDNISTDVCTFIDVCTFTGDDYMDWSWEQIANWIINLNPNKYGKYEVVLKDKLSIENVTGDQLDNINKADLHRFGVTDVDDNVEIMEQIVMLITSS